MMTGVGLEKWHCTYSCAKKHILHIEVTLLKEGDKYDRCQSDNSEFAKIDLELN